MESIAQSLKSLLPKQQKKIFPATSKCIYCGNIEDLTVEHIIPFGFGGRLELPNASCKQCAEVTSSFELTCLRTMFGPLRLLYGLPTRRKKKRPAKLKLKVKVNPDDDWTYTEVKQDRYPFLVAFPFLTEPKILTDEKATPKGASTKRIWIRGASPSYVFDDLLEELVRELGVSSLMPEATTQVKEFVQLIAKIAHSYAVATLGEDAFTPYLIPHILEKKLDDADLYIGSVKETEGATNVLHEIDLLEPSPNGHVVVRIRLLAIMDTPTYIAVVGKTNQISANKSLQATGTSPAA